MAHRIVARCWVMPFDNYDTMTIKGTYLNARYFSFSAYDTNNGIPVDLAGRLYDVQIGPDPGSNNPYIKPGAGAGTYTVVISSTGQTAGNTIKVHSGFAWVALRVYVPHADPSLGGQSLMGEVPLPTIFVNGASQELQPCSPINKLTDMQAFLIALSIGVRSDR